jgi:hypothetical protein
LSLREAGSWACDFKALRSKGRGLMGITFGAVLFIWLSISMAFSERGCIAHGVGMTTGLNFIVETKGSYNELH